MNNEIITETGNEANDKNSPETKPAIWKNHPFLTTVLLTPPTGIVLAALWALIFYHGLDLEELPELIIVGALGGCFFIFPWVITAAEIYLAVKGHGREKTYKKGRIFDVAGILLGVLYSLIYLEETHSVVFRANWDAVLYNTQTHPPIYTHSSLTIWILALVGFAGYLTVNFFVSLKKTPPLVPVLGMAAMYLGTVESIIWGI
ncbi:MAG: hypothetical protein K2H45_11065, partial [Acetatifactor sp.]|nr:hypothetical protein [Acetatifactor sp.]